MLKTQTTLAQGVYWPLSQKPWSRAAFRYGLVQESTLCPRDPGCSLSPSLSSPHAPFPGRISLRPQCVEQPEPREVQTWNRFAFCPIISLPCALMNLLSLSLMIPETGLRSFWSLLGTKRSRPLCSCLKLQSPSECPSIPFAQADLRPEEAALGRECCLFSHPPFSPVLAPSGSPSSPRLGALKQIPKSCFSGLLPGLPCSGLCRHRTPELLMGILGPPHHTMGGGAPVPTASSCPTASRWWGLLVAVSFLEQQ